MLGTTLAVRYGHDGQTGFPRYGDNRTDERWFCLVGFTVGLTGYLGRSLAKGFQHHSAEILYSYTFGGHMYIDPALLSPGLGAFGGRCRRRCLAARCRLHATFSRSRSARRI